jgi:hypothetical protein
LKSGRSQSDLARGEVDRPDAAVGIAIRGPDEVRALLEDRIDVESCVECGIEQRARLFKRRKPPVALL